MDVEAAKAFLHADTNEPPSSLSGLAAGDSLTNLAPQTASALSDMIPPEPNLSGVQSPTDIMAGRDAAYQARNAIPGIPLDTKTGVSSWERFVLSFAREKKNQVAYLQKNYGEDNVRLDSSGDMIVRAVDSDTGKPKDIKVKGDDISLKDFIDLAGSMPEIAAGILSAKAGRGIQWKGLGAAKGMLGLQRDIAAVAAGAETAGAAKDVAAGLAMKGSEDVGDVLKERGKAAIGDVLIGEATMGAGRFLKFMGSPLAGSRGPVQFDAIGARQYFKDKYGIDVPLSIGESTGSPLVSRTEAFMEKMPGGGTPFTVLKGEQETKLRQLQSIMMGKAPSSDEEVGRQLIDKINQTLTPVKASVEAGKETLAKTGTQGIEDMVTGLTMPERQLLKSDTGAAVRDAVIEKRDLAKAEADRLYDIVRNTPGGTGKTFDTTDLSKQASDILKSLPRKGNVPLSDFAPPDVINRLETLVNLKRTKLSLSELQQMRRDTIEAIGTSEGAPGRGAHYLGQISDALTQTIEKGAASMPGGQLKTALEAANLHYKEQVVPFNRLGITEMFKKPDEAGAISNSEIISRLFGGGKAVQNYDLLKETLTPGSVEFTKVKRAIADNLLERSRYPGGDLIDPDSFINNLSQFRRDYKEIADDVFGTKATQMMKMAKTMSIGGMTPSERESAGIGGTPKISSTEFASLLSDPNPTAGKLRNLIAAESKRDDLYKNQLMGAVAKGELPGKSLNPEDFVNRFLGKASPSDVKEVMDLVGRPTTTSTGATITPPLLDDVRAKVVEKVFRDAGRSATPGDIGKLMSGDPTRIMTGTSLFKQIGEPGMKEKLQDILGPSTYEDLKQYINILSSGEAKERQFQAAGGLAAGMQIAELTRNGPLKYMYSAGKDWVVAQLMTRQPLRNWLSSVPSSADPGAISLLLSSPPFIKAVTDEFGKGTGADAFIFQIKQSVDKWVRMDAPKQQQAAPQPDFDRNQQMMRDFLHR